MNLYNKNVNFFSNNSHITKYYNVKTLSENNQHESLNNRVRALLILNKIKVRMLTGIITGSCQLNKHSNIGSIETLFAEDVRKRLLFVCYATEIFVGIRKNKAVRK